MSLSSYSTRSPGSTEGHTLFGMTMGFVALTAGCFAFGAYLGRSLSGGWIWVFFILALVLLVGMRFTVRASRSSSTALLLGFGLTLGLATGPTVAYYAGSDPAAVWEAAAATGLFMAGLGSIGFATRSDLSGLATVAMWALVALILFGVVSILVQIPGASLAYSLIGLVIFAALVLVDFQRLRRIGNIESAPLLAASIFLDALNIFLFFLNIFSRRD